MDRSVDKDEDVDQYPRVSNTPSVDKDITPLKPPSNSSVEHQSTNVAVSQQSTPSREAVPATGAGNHCQQSSNTASNNEADKMKIFATANVTNHSRHARRIYVGGVPPNYADEEALKNFLNDVISRGLGEENDHSYVLSIYMNQKKCYSFVELKSIELTTASLDLDGIIFKKIVLKVLRANEYRPELVPASSTRALKLDLSAYAFGTPAVLSNSSSTDDSHSTPENQRAIVLPPHNCLASLIQFTNVTGMELGSISIVGFPYDNSSKRLGLSVRGLGCAAAPRALRTSMSKYHHGAVVNSEYGIDLSTIKFMDVGDVLAGKSNDDTRGFLSTTVAELASRSSIPFVVGGSKDQLYCTAMGLMSAAGPSIGVMSISSQVDHHLVGNDSFCPIGPSSSADAFTQQAQQQRLSPNCQGRYVVFGAQGSQSDCDATRQVLEGGGKVVWLTKDLRTPNTSSVAVPQYLKYLRGLSRSVKSCVAARSAAATLPGDPNFPSIMVSLDAGVLCSAHSPLCNNSCSSIGLSLEEVLEMAFISGAHPNVVLFEVTGFSPESEDARSNLLLADILYKFSLGVATRPLYAATDPTARISGAVSTDSAQHVFAGTGGAVGVGVGGGHGCGLSCDGVTDPSAKPLRSASLGGSRDVTDHWDPRNAGPSCQGPGMPFHGAAGTASGGGAAAGVRGPSTFQSRRGGNPPHYQPGGSQPLGTGNIFASPQRSSTGGTPTSGTPTYLNPAAANFVSPQHSSTGGTPTSGTPTYLNPAAANFVSSGGALAAGRGSSGTKPSSFRGTPPMQQQQHMHHSSSPVLGGGRPHRADMDLGPSLHSSSADSVGSRTGFGHHSRYQQHTQHSYQPQQQQGQAQTQYSYRQSTQHGNNDPRRFAMHGMTPLGSSNNSLRSSASGAEGSAVGSSSGSFYSSAETSHDTNTTASPTASASASGKYGPASSAMGHTGLGSANQPQYIRGRSGGGSNASVSSASTSFTTASFNSGGGFLQLRDGGSGGGVGGSSGVGDGNLSHSLLHNPSNGAAPPPHGGNGASLGDSGGFGGLGGLSGLGGLGVVSLSFDESAEDQYLTTKGRGSLNRDHGHGGGADIDVGERSGCDYEA